MLNSQRNVLIIDTSLHSMRYLHASKSEETKEEGQQMFKYKFLNGIIDFIEHFKADECILAIDSKKNWRKSVFPYYKSKRKLKRKKIDEEDHPWFCFSEYYEMLDVFLKEVEENFPFKFVEVESAEADDVAGILASCEALANDNKIIITSDQDYIQLLQNPFTKIYNPIKKQYMTSKDPKKDLLEKIVLGDSGDDIPSIKDKHSYKPEFFQFCVKEGVADNEENARIKIDASEELFLKMELKFYAKYYLKPSRATKFSKKVFNSLYDEGILKEHVMDDEVLKERFIRNNKLINLTAQPKEIKQQILEAYKISEAKGDPKELFNFFILNSYNHFIDDCNRICRVLKPLKK
jgi:hypothetical protein